MPIIYEQQGHYDQAREIYNSGNQDLPVRPRLPDVAKSNGNIGVVYYSQSKYEPALEYYQKSLDIKIKVSGQDSLDVAKSYGNIGNVLDDMGRPEEALVHLQKDLEIQLKLLVHLCWHTIYSFRC
jgi:tetratricopeptide (TPR) repeat protein